MGFAVSLKSNVFLGFDAVVHKNFRVLPSRDENLYWVGPLSYCSLRISTVSAAVCPKTSGVYISSAYEGRWVKVPDAAARNV